jgi:hypothetical protein
MRLLKEKQDIEDNRTFADIVEEIKHNINIMATEYIPQLCTALKRENPLIAGVVIRSRVIEAVSKPNGPWAESTIRNNWPQWLKNEKMTGAVKQQWKDSPKSAGRPPIANSKIAISQDDLDREEEEDPVSSVSLEEYEETHPTVEENPFEALGKINRAVSNLWTQLTGKQGMPHMEDNIKVDHIAPTRNRFTDIMNGSTKTERDFLFNWLNWLNLVIKDRIDLIEKSDKTAHDTRK